MNIKPAVLLKALEEIRVVEKDLLSLVKQDYEIDMSSVTRLGQSIATSGDDIDHLIEAFVKGEAHSPYYAISYVVNRAKSEAKEGCFTHKKQKEVDMLTPAGRIANIDNTWEGTNERSDYRNPYLTCIVLRKRINLLLGHGYPLEPPTGVKTNKLRPEYNGPVAFAEALSEADNSHKLEAVPQLGNRSAVSNPKCAANGQFPVPMSFRKQVLDAGLFHQTDFGGKFYAFPVTAERVECASGDEQDIEVYLCDFVYTSSSSSLPDLWSIGDSSRGRYHRNIYKTLSNSIVVTSNDYAKQSDIASPTITKTLYPDHRTKANIDKQLFRMEALASVEDSPISIEIEWKPSNSVDSEQVDYTIEPREGKMLWTNTAFVPGGLPHKAPHSNVKKDRRYMARWKNDDGKSLVCTGTTPNRAVSVMKRRTRTDILDLLDF
jgi:hypothetical protein